MKIKMRPIAECKECGYQYIAPPWEPTFLAQIAYRQGHDEWHDETIPYRAELHPLVIRWRKWERERIIELLKGEAFTTPRNEVAVSEKLDILIALINGDNNASE